MTSPAQKGEREGVLERFIESTIRDVCELPDRSSPEDQPEMMLVTGKELEMILRDQLEASSLLSSAKAAGEMREALERAAACLDQAGDALDNLGAKNTGQTFFDAADRCRAALSSNSPDSTLKEVDHA